MRSPFPLWFAQVLRISEVSVSTSDLSNQRQTFPNTKRNIWHSFKNWANFPGFCSPAGWKNFMGKMSWRAFQFLVPSVIFYDSSSQVLLGCWDCWKYLQWQGPGVGRVSWWCLMVWAPSALLTWVRAIGRVGEADLPEGRLPLWVFLKGKRTRFWAQMCMSGLYVKPGSAFLHSKCTHFCTFSL